MEPAGETNGVRICSCIHASLVPGICVLNLTFFIYEYGTLNCLILQSLCPRVQPGIAVYCLGKGGIECLSTLGYWLCFNLGITVLVLKNRVL